MTRIVTLEHARTPPEFGAILETQGIPPQADLPAHILDLIEQGVELYGELANPRGIYEEVHLDVFAEVYGGEGRNEHKTPLEDIARRAIRLALFAVTIGDAVDRKIRELFDANEPALAYMLDGIASERADATAALLGRDYLEELRDEGVLPGNGRVLGYSPGYCGWHMTGQRQLFVVLRPERIGISLNASCLMQPLKSVSGIFVAGPPEIHEFDDDFDFCHDCTTHQCRDRIESVRLKE